jgi:hypothetical protein
MVNASTGSGGNCYNAHTSAAWLALDVKVILIPPCTFR